MEKRSNIRHKTWRIRHVVWRKKPERGFLLIEAVIAIAILAIGITTLIGGIAQAIKVQDKANHTTEAILELEKFLYELETGRRLDLLTYGGREKIQAYDLEVKSEEATQSVIPERFYRESRDPRQQHSGMTGIPSFYHLKTSLSWKEGRDFLNQELFIGETQAI